MEILEEVYWDSAQYESELSFGNQKGGFDGRIIYNYLLPCLITGGYIPLLAITEKWPTSSVRANEAAGNASGGG